MSILKPVLVLVILSSAFLCNNAYAITPPPRVGATPDLPRADDSKVDDKAISKPAGKPARPPKRRAVRQIIDSPSLPGPGPQVVIPPPLPVPVGVKPPLSPALLPPIVHGCPGPACLDPSGAQYHGGVGTTLLGPQGQTCSNNGITVQCF